MNAIAQRLNMLGRAGLAADREDADAQCAVDLQSMIDTLTLRSGVAGLQVTLHEQGGATQIVAASRMAYDQLPGLTNAAIEHCRAKRFRLAAVGDGADSAIVCRSSAFDGDVIVLTFWNPAGFDAGFDGAHDGAEILFAYLRLWLSSRRQRRSANRLAAALDGLDYGVLLLDGSGGLIFGNAAADDLLDRQVCLRRAGGRVTAVGTADAIRLNTILDHVTSRADDVDLPPVLRLGQSFAGQSLIVTIVPLQQAGEDDDAPAAALYLIDPSTDLEPMLRRACTLYRLSPAEARLAIHVVRGATLTEAARELRIKEATARSCLKQIFIKTETRRQAELVRCLVSSLVQARFNTAQAMRPEALRFGSKPSFAPNF